MLMVGIAKLDDRFKKKVQFNLKKKSQILK